MTKKQRKQRLKSLKKAAKMFGTAAVLAVPVALAVPGFASASPEIIPQPTNLPVVIKSINSALANEHASKLIAGSNFQIDLNTIFEDADTLVYTVVVQNISVADVKVTNNNTLSINLKKTGSTMVDLIVHKPNESMSIHERFSLKVGANGALDPDQDGAGIADIIKYFNSHGGEFHSTSDFRTLLQAAVSSTLPTPNHAPIASSETTPIAMTAGTYTEIHLNDLFSDEDGDELSFELINPPSTGSFVSAHLESESSTLVLYATNASSQPLIVTVDGTDGEESATKLFSVTVGAAPVENHAPVANELSVVVLNEDTTASIQLGGTDADDDELTAIIVEDKGPTHGELIASSSEQNKFTYVPDENYNGPDSFTYIVNDGTVDSEEVTVNITVNAVNDAPVAQDISFEVNEGASKEVNFNGWDADSGETLQYIIVDEPEYGTVTPDSPNPGQFTYVQNNGTSVSDSFTYKIYDGQAYSDVKTVAITIIDVNHAPVASEHSVVELDEDTTTSIQLGGTDADDDELTAIIVEGKGPTHGELIASSAEQNKFTYVPDENYNGPDSFTYIVNDGTVDSEEVTVNITVNAVNDAPVAQDISFEVNEGASKEVNFNGWDADSGETLQYIIVDEPEYGTVTPDSPNPGQFTYVQNNGTSESDSFTYKIYDGQAYSNVKTVAITIIDVNHAPVASDLSVVELDEDTATSIQLGGTDADDDELTAIIVEGKGPTHGELIPNSSEQNKFTYVPDENYNGSDSFTYIVNDGKVDSEEVTVTVNITPIDDAPVAGIVGQEGYIQLHRNQNAKLDLSKVFTEVDGQQLTYRTNFQGNGYSLKGTFNGTDLYLNALGSFSFSSFDLQASDDGFETWVTIPVSVEVYDGEFGSLRDVDGISNMQDEYTVDLADYFEGDYGHYFSYILEPPFSSLQIIGSTLTVPLVDDHNVNVVVSAWDDHGLTITDEFNLHVGVGLKDIGVQFFNNYDMESYVDHNAHIYMKDIFQNADEFRVTAYNDEEVMSIGSYELGEWTSEDYLSLWTDATFTNVSEITVEGRTLNGQIVTNERSYTLRIRENTAPYVDHESEMPTPLKKGETVELLVTDAEGDPITSVVAQPDDSICGESGICISTTYVNGTLFVKGEETGTRSLRISTSDGLPFGDDSVYRYFTVYDDSIDIVDDFSIDKDLEGLLTGMNLGSLTLLGVESEYMIHDPGATLNGTTLHFDVNSEVMYPGASEFITVTITDGTITRVLTLYMNVAWVEPGPGSA